MTTMQNHEKAENLYQREKMCEHAAGFESEISVWHYTRVIDNDK